MKIPPSEFFLWGGIFVSNAKLRSTISLYKRVDKSGQSKHAFLKRTSAEARKQVTLAWCWGSIFFSRGGGSRPITTHPSPDGSQLSFFKHCFFEGLFKPFAGRLLFSDSREHNGSLPPHGAATVLLCHCTRVAGDCQEVAFQGRFCRVVMPQKRQ